MGPEDTYLHAVERMLRDIAPEHRVAVLDDLRGHFADAAEVGRPLDETIAALGTPKEIADRAREEFGDGDSSAERAWWTLQGTATALSCVIGVVAAFVMPLYAGATSTTSSDGTVTSTTGSPTLVEVNGLAIALVALVPALVAAVPLVVPRRVRVTTAAICGALLMLMVFVGGFTIGGFFMPTLLLTWTALIVWLRLRGRGFSHTWRIAGGILTALPFGWLLFGRFDPAQISAWAWPAIAVVLLLAVLVAFGAPSAGWLLALIGLVIVAVGLFSGQLFTMLVIWLGSWWLTIGLAHALTTPKRS